MIKVIASDMDGTLLNDAHEVSPRTVEAVRRACEQGIRFIIITGRNLTQAMEQIGGLNLTCDYILASGAEVRDSDQKLVSRINMDLDLCEEIYEELKKWSVSVIFATDQYDYRIGTPQEVEDSIILQAQIFHANMTREEILESPLYDRMKANTRGILSMEELREAGVPVYKIFLCSGDFVRLQKLEKVLSKDRRIAVASSFVDNLEITDVRAQKGPILKTYIESLGYTMDEVLVFGDSMNDYSMLSMDFGATVAMGNAIPEIKKAAKYVTKTNEEGGVAYVIEKLLSRRQGLQESGGKHHR